MYSCQVNTACDAEVLGNEIMFVVCNIEGRKYLARDQQTIIITSEYQGFSTRGIYYRSHIDENFHFFGSSMIHNFVLILPLFIRASLIVYTNRAPGVDNVHPGIYDDYHHT